MIYVDTSALVPAFLREARSEAVLDWLEGSGARIAVSEWTVTEFASACAHKAAEGLVSGALARQAQARFLQFSARHCFVGLPQRAEYRRAAELASDPAMGLMPGEALHLAIAEALNVRGLLTFDDAMIAGAKAIGLAPVAIQVNRHP